MLVRYRCPEGRAFTPEELDEAVATDVIQLDLEKLHLALGEADLHIIEMVGGEGGGATKVLMGIAIIGGAWFMSAPAALAAGSGSLFGGMGASAFSLFGMSVSYGQIALIGGIIALSGVSELLTKKPKKSYSSFTLSQDNVTNQGGPVPLAYGGPIRVASVVISSSVANIAVAANGTVIATPGKDGTISVSGETAGLYHLDQSYADPNAPV